MDAVLSSPSREAVLADLEALAEDFGRLFATDCECTLLSERRYWPSRFADPNRQPKGFSFWARKSKDVQPKHVLGGAGFDVRPVGSKTREDFAKNEIFYDRSGRPVVNVNGESLIAEPGWSDCHELFCHGPCASRAIDTIRRANDLAGDALGFLAAILWPGRSVASWSLGWPCVVNRVADIAGRSVLKATAWHVDLCVDGVTQLISLDVWRRRDAFAFGGPMVAPEIAERIGDNPEQLVAERKAFLRDSELAARWLIEQLTDPAGDDRGGDPIPLGDGLQCDDTMFVWGGKTYTSITPAMVPLLKVLMRAYRQGRDATLSEFEAVAGEIKDGFGRCFDVGKHPNRSKHPVWESIKGGRGKYRLIDPVKVKNGSR